MWTPRARSLLSTRLAIVDLPAPERPVNHRIAGRWCLIAACASRSTVRSWRWMLVARRRPWAIIPAAAVSLVDAVDQDEGAGLAVLDVGVEGDRRRGGEIAEADLVERQRLRRQLVEIVDVDAVLELGHRGGRRPRADLHQIGAAGQHRLVAHPDEMGGELVGDFGPAVGRREHVAARDVDFVGERQRHRVARFRLLRRRRRRAGCR